MPSNDETLGQTAKGISSAVRQQTGFLLLDEQELIGNWLYADASKAFIELAKDAEGLAEHLTVAYRATFTMDPPSEERDSWKNSLPAFAELLDSAGLGNQIVILEYCLPSQDKNYPQRIDAIIAGADELGRINAVITELKQWADVPMRPSSKYGHLQLKMRGGWKDIRHARVQVKGYHTYMNTMLKICEMPENFLNFHSFVYLHNAKDLPEQKRNLLFSREFNDGISKMYTADYQESAQKFLQRTVGFGQPDVALERFQQLKERAITHITNLPKRIPYDDIIMNRSKYSWRYLVSLFIRWTIILGVIGFLLYAFFFVVRLLIRTLFIPFF